MARADLLKKLFQSYQKRDDRTFQVAAEEIIDEERKKHHPVLANELEKILKNGVPELNSRTTLTPFDPPPQDSDRRTALLEVRRPEHYLQDLVLGEIIRSSVERLLREFRGWEVLQTNGLLPVRRVLFCGPSGCGKTVTAEAIAAEFGLPLLYVRFDGVVSSLLGETAANLRKVFDYARRGQWVMLFDEFDAIGRSRDDATEHGEIKRVVNSFLQIMDSFDGRSLIIAATNFEQVLDPAVWRRFDEVIRFAKPTGDQLRDLIRKRLVPLRFHDDHMENLVTELSGATYADGERMCLDVRKSCVLRGDRQVREEDVAEAIERYFHRRTTLEKASGSGIPAVDKE